MIDLKTRRHFGIEQLGTFTSDTTEMYEAMLEDAIRQDMMLALIAPYGSGKTHLLRRVKEQLTADGSVSFVHVADMQDDKVRMASILSALVRDLTTEDEKPRRTVEARSRQVVRLLGLRRAVENTRVCLVIEDAHRLHANTLSALKLLRERDFNGVCPLLSIVLLGWHSLDEKLQRRRDILTRMQRLHLIPEEGWMTYPERLAYLAQRYGQLVEEETRDDVAGIHHVPIEMDHAVAQALREARLAGYDRVDGRTFRPPLRERYERLKTQHGVTLSDIGDAAGGIAKQSALDAINTEKGKNVGPVEEGIRRLERKQRGSRNGNVHSLR